jgi:hypothetical protein
VQALVSAAVAVARGNTLTAVAVVGVLVVPGTVTATDAVLSALSVADTVGDSAVVSDASSQDVRVADYTP